VSGELQIPIDFSKRKSHWYSLAGTLEGFRGRFGLLQHSSINTALPEI
jgi:hypothetical protein